jgi:hypothetical protein
MNLEHVTAFTAAIDCLGHQRSPSRPLHAINRGAISILTGEAIEHCDQSAATGRIGHSQRSGLQRPRKRANVG